MTDQATQMLRLPYAEVVATLRPVLLGRGFAEEPAATLAGTFADNSLDGVQTHGLNRFSRFIGQVDKGQVKPGESAEPVQALGALEQWEGRLGAGVLNAITATDRAMDLAREHGLGCVALANTNHWMRGGTYGWRAARQGCIFIGWTNTIANMPAWGALDSKLGNNPLILAVPYGDEAIVLDMAQSQFSYGAMESARSQQKPLPVPGGYDAQGELSRDPDAILQTQRALPVGYWKGAGLSLLLDILATLLSGGLSTAQITRQGAEYGVSQVFVAVDTAKLGSATAIEQAITAIIEDYKGSRPVSVENAVRYPGEGAVRHRQTNRREGVPVDARVWQAILAL